MSLKIPALKNLKYKGKPKGSSTLEKRELKQKAFKQFDFYLEGINKTKQLWEFRDMQNYKTKKAIFIFTQDLKMFWNGRRSNESMNDLSLFSKQI